MTLSRRPIVLAGDFAGNCSGGISYRFRFCGDGTYFYTAEQRGMWTLAHRGKFRVADLKVPGRPDWKRKVVRLEPKTMDRMPESVTAISLLEERALPTNRTEEYIVSLYELPGRKDQLSFELPDSNGSMFATSFWLEKLS